MSGVGRECAWTTKHPKDQRSARKSASWLLIASGDMYSGVPTNSFHLLCRPMSRSWPDRGVVSSGNGTKQWGF